MAEPSDAEHIALIVAPAEESVRGTCAGEVPCLAGLVACKVDLEDPSVRARSAKARHFLREQNELIDACVALHEGKSVPGEEEDESAKHRCFSGAQAAKWSLIINVILLAGKILAAVFSGSLSIISTVVDSTLDLFSGTVFYVVSQVMSKRETSYPIGKKRFEPLAVIFVACVMGTASFEVILISVDSMVTGPTMPVIEWSSISVVIAVVLIKTGLYLYCRAIDSTSAQALAADHINDIVSNLAVLAALFLTRHISVYADPAGAIIVSVFIIVNWMHQGLEHVRNLASYMAPNKLLRLATFVAAHHAPDIVAVDTVRGYGFGNDCILEVDIVLPETTPLGIAHDIGESLQLRLERLDGVERAFVHLDYETAHKYSDEHRDNYKEGAHSSTLDYSHVRRCDSSSHVSHGSAAGSVREGLVANPHVHVHSVGSTHDNDSELDHHEQEEHREDEGLLSSTTGAGE